MKKSLLRGIAVVMAVVLIVAAAPQPAAHAAPSKPGANIEHISGEIDQISFCGSPTMDITFAGIIRSSSTATKSGFNVAGGFSVNFTGVDGNGVTYTATNTSSFNFHLAAGGTLTSTENLTLVGSDGSSYPGHALYHITMNPDGTVTVVVNLQSGCVAE